MKRIQLIEWGIIAIALIFGYKAFDGFLSLIFQFIGFVLNNGEIGSLVLAFLIAVIYFVCLVVLIRNSRSIATYLNGPKADDDMVPLKIGKRALLQVILIGICSYTILTHIADVIYYIVKVFKDEAGGSKINESLFSTSDGSVIPAIIAAIQVACAIIVIYHSKSIVVAMIRKDEIDELTFDSKPGN